MGQNSDRAPGVSVHCCTGLGNAKKDSDHEPEMSEMNYPYLFQMIDKVARPYGRTGGASAGLRCLQG